MTGTARDDYPTLGWHAYHHERTNLGEQLRAALNEIDQLRQDCFAHEDEADFLRGRLADLAAQLTPSTHPKHYCRTCSDGSGVGDGCHNCRGTGMDQSPCPTCNREVLG